MKQHLFVPALLASLLSIGGCTVQPKTQLDAPVAITTQIEGKSLLDSKASPPATIKVRFEDNPELATLIENDLVARGFQLVGADQAPDVDILIQSAWRFQKPRARQQAVSVGKLLADERMKGTVTTLEERATRAASTNVNLNTAIAANRGTLSTGAYAGVTLLEVVADLTGVRGGFNRLMVGDERGLCIPVPAGACDTWHVYKQDMALAATLTRKDGQDSVVRAISKVEHERLLPVELFEETRSKLVSALAN